jgi:hypothetical protein
VITVTEIKRAIDKLSPQERCELEALLHPRPDDDWDRQMQADAEPGGKLHKMMSVSRKDAPGAVTRAGKWPRKTMADIEREARLVSPKAEPQVRFAEGIRALKGR